MAIEKPPLGIINNDLLNPSFETVESPVEVQRNYVKNPNFVGTHSYWGGVVDGAAIYEAVSSSVISSEPGDVWSSSVTITNPPGAPSGTVEFYGTLSTNGGYYGTMSPPYFEYTLGPGETITVSQPGSIVSAGADGVRVQLKLPIGVILSEAIVTKTSEVVPYFDGSTSPDPYLTPSWTGAPNESESVLHATPVTGVSNGWSTDQWAVSGERSLRVPEDVAIANLTDDQRFSIVARDAGQHVFLDGILHYTTKRSPETVVVKSPGLVVLGEGYWDDGMVVREDYDGPYFDGDTPPFRYRGQMVTPQWMDGDPGFVKSRLGDYYEVQPWNPTAQWSKPENRRFTIGADRGMLYRDGLGVAWSGLVNVSRSGNDGDVGKRYIDGTLFNVSVPSSDYSATLEAFTYPDEFDACIGNLEYENTPGITIYGQENQPFDLSYRTLQGDANGYGEEYTIHLVYNCMAVDSGTEHATINDSPEIGAFSFEIHGIPQIIPNAKPSAYFSINSRDVNRGLLARLEEILYGTDGSVPRIPTIEEIREFLNTE